MPNQRKRFLRLWAVIGLAALSTVLSTTALYAGGNLSVLLLSAILVFPFSPFPLIVIFFLSVPLILIFGQTTGLVLLLLFLFAANLLAAGLQLVLLHAVRKRWMKARSKL
ncbi:hypothetical protein [Subtercola endophyticus]|uniref:hypothetical protein n=1 Tax=Subtercola endophyticus TaxID=2895559 RepID=UPI001E40C027|nr:hypothetical protein [Subtercola endophyticus]UFS58696.1 hypothetical protein LQ955_17125 [Subtercola endophyticus]